MTKLLELLMKYRNLFLLSVLVITAMGSPVEVSSPSDTFTVVITPSDGAVMAVSFR